MTTHKTEGSLDQDPGFATAALASMFASGMSEATVRWPSVNCLALARLPFAPTFQDRASPADGAPGKSDPARNSVLSDQSMHHAARVCFRVMTWG